MNFTLTPIDRCAEIAGLRSHEIVLGIIPDARHERMLARYRRTDSGGTARARVVADIRDALEIGASRRAGDLLIVLRRLLAESATNVARCARQSPARRRRPARLRASAPIRSAARAAGAKPSEPGTVLAWRRESANPKPESVV